MTKQINFLATILLTTLLFVGCNKKGAITGNIKGQDNDTIYVTMVSLDNGETLNDTIYAVNGKLSFTPQVEGATIVTFFPQSEMGEYEDSPLNTVAHIITYYTPGSKVEFEAEYYAPSVIDYNIIKGDQLNHDLSLASKNILEQKASFANNLIKLWPIRNQDGANILNQALYEDWQEMQNIAEEYVKGNPDSQLSGYYLGFVTSPDFAEEQYDKISDDVKNGVFKYKIDQQIQIIEREKEKEANKEKIVEGTIAPDFTLKSLSGDDLSLYSIESDYLVLDFWGSWCGWCIIGFPKMQEYYNKYQGRLEILGIACQDTEAKWKEAVDEHKLEWLNVINSDKVDLPTMYGVSAFPTKLILDKNKEIVSIFIGESDEFYNKLDELLQ